MNLRRKLENLFQSRAYWSIYLVGGLLMLSTALYSQHVNDELPCVVCIHIRLWISLFVLLAILALLSRDNRILNAISHLFALIIAVGLTERSYLLLGTERGFIFADCGFELGLPAWFAIDEWLPSIYRIETSCGYTPELVFSITMAEALMVISVLLVFLSSSVALAGLMAYKTRD